MKTNTENLVAHPEHFWLRGVRPERPVEFDANAGLWNVYGYPQAQRILSDPATFSSDATRVFPAGTDSSFAEGDLTLMDPPQHRKLRALVSKAFTPKIVADLEPRIVALTAELLDAVAGRDRIELVHDLAHPLPVIVIADLLGVPASDRELFKQWGDTLFQRTNQFSLNENHEETTAEFASQLELLQPMYDYLREHAAERRRRPREDLLTKLVLAEVDDKRLNDNEVVNFAGLLLLAGHITTTMLLGNTILCLDAYPEQAALVRADRTLVPAAIEESLRMLTPFAMTGRVTNSTVTLAGQDIPADELLMVWVAAANRDEHQFPDPHVFDIAREPNPHLAFGRGIHFCLGAPLARLEGRVAVNILLDRFPRLRTDPDNRPTIIPPPEMTGVRALPLLTS